MMHRKEMKEGYRENKRLEVHSLYRTEQSYILLTQKAFPGFTGDLPQKVFLSYTRTIGRLTV